MYVIKKRNYIWNERKELLINLLKSTHKITDVHDCAERKDFKFQGNCKNII